MGRHRGTYRTHRIDEIESEQAQRNACPLCLHSWRARKLEPITHHSSFYGPGGLRGIDTCYEHYQFITDLFWLQTKERAWRDVVPTVR